MAEYIEQYIPVVQQVGLQTKKNIILGGSANLDLSGTSGFVKGLSQQVLSSQPSTVTLTSGQSGALCLFDSAAGIVYTLPAGNPGEWFEFAITTTITSNSAKVITNTGTVFLAGAVTTSVDNTANKQWVGNGTSHVAITQNGSTTGGVIGSSFFVSCISSTLWVVSGNLVGSGTLATPFATS